ncbi:epithelial cell-transforming sequence 2 oncogene-like isoform X2 [Corticium candelabrum]|uniref:epithelial cell-transforming sequence 2 oncogene-like isoform X2 n=1 Tax=Corticium candelabrum TaxID=121492 RepID=UPI002E26FEDA|nr:epithelial cell-transforming sequence 2 oncogene-like isoform X2 [Corticium candelabrum]
MKMQLLLASLEAENNVGDADRSNEDQQNTSKLGKSWKKPPWLDPDPHPEDLEKGWKAIQTGTLDSTSYGSLRLHYGTHSSLSKTHAQATALSIRGMTPEQEPRRRRIKTDPNKIEYLSDDEVIESRPVSAIPLSRSFDARGVMDGSRSGSLLDLIYTTDLKHNVSGGIYPETSHTDLRALEQGYPHYSHPPVLFISSQTIAYELLLDALLFGVLPIVYEYDATTLDALLIKLKFVLSGRQARSIGMFLDGDLRTLNVVPGHVTTVSSLDSSHNVRHFWEELTGNVVSLEQGGRVDIFSPVASTEEGTLLLQHLETLTGTKFSAPTHIAPTFRQIKSEWLGIKHGELSPPAVYFDQNKLNAWANMAEHVQEALSSIKNILKSYLTVQHTELSGRIAGQAVFECLGLVDSQRHFNQLSNMASLMVEGINTVSPYASSEEAVLHLSEYLREHAKSVVKPTAATEIITNGDMSEIHEFEAIPHKHQQEDGSIGNSSDEDASQFSSPEPRSVEQRTVVSQRLLQTEVTYMRTLSVFQTVFVLPLKAAIDSNKPIISAVNLRLMVSDVEAILSLSKVLIGDLAARLETWSATQCLGDVVLKFSGQLKVYTNYVNNYSVTLATVERCEEQSGAFRGFIKRHERQPASLMLSLTDFLLIPMTRISQYLDLLEELKRNTPKDHPDRRDVILASKAIRCIDDLIRETREHFRHDRQMQQLQSIIADCPKLVEGNRRFIGKTEVVQLKTPKGQKSRQHGFGGYQPVQDMGLFLFSDALVVTSLTTKHFPLERAFARNHHYLASVALTNLQVFDCPDSKYIHNAFILKTPKHRWTCQSYSQEAKFSWLSILETTRHAAIPIESTPGQLR